MKLYFKILPFLLILASCQHVQQVSDAITNPSARDVFEREIKGNDSLYKIYEYQYNIAKQNQLQLELPVTLSSKSDSIQLKILSYTIELKRGERFKLQSNRHADSLRLFIDLFDFKNDSMVSKKPIVSNQPMSNTIELDVTKDGKYKVVICSDIINTVDFGLAMFTTPSLNFPVSGKENSAIQSFWGASRSGGKRSHQGIDIFANRGTPAIAAANGYISNTGNRGLGGKQVWLRDGLLGQSLYYAHLDSITVYRGMRVKRGDTLGLVGNTGNAKTTKPHLHFGIYTSTGAIDPLPFVKLRTPPKIENQKINSIGNTKLNVNELRIGAGIRNKKLTDLDRNLKIDILARTDSWFHIKINDTLQGFMHETLIDTDD